MQDTPNYDKACGWLNSLPAMTDPNAYFATKFDIKHMVLELKAKRHPYTNIHIRRLGYS